MKVYAGLIPPCGVYCGGCPRYKNEKSNACDGADVGCRKCKTIFACTEKRGIDFCFECDNYPCSRFKKFRRSWLSYGEDLFENQALIKVHGPEHLTTLYRIK